MGDDNFNRRIMWRASRTVKVLLAFLLIDVASAVSWSTTSKLGAAQGKIETRKRNFIFSQTSTVSTQHDWSVA